MELVLEQQRSCRAEGGCGLEGLGWSSREAAGERVTVRVSARVSAKVRVVVRVTVTVTVTVRGTYFHTHMHARQGCQACGSMRVARDLVENGRVVKRVAAMPHATTPQPRARGFPYPAL